MADCVLLVGVKKADDVKRWLDEITETVGRLRGLVDNPPEFEISATPGDFRD
jgi:hypothetical protein